MDELDGQNDTEFQKKLPFRCVKFAVKRVVDIAIPLHLQQLEDHHESIKQFRNEENWSALHGEELKACNTVSWLKEDLHSLQAISAQVEEKDQQLFQQEAQETIEKVLYALASFLELYPHVMTAQPRFPGSSLISPSDEFPTLVCNLDEPASVSDDNRCFVEDPLPEIQVFEPLKAKRWSKLRNELVELNELFKKFANLVFSQKEHVDTIEGNVQQACDNVQEGTRQLRKAVVLQAAVFPAAGAAIGGLLLGPVGAAAGFKLFGSVACALSGCALGYGAGWKLRQKRRATCDIEMKALTYSSRTVSLSSPEIAQIPKLVLNGHGEANDANSD